jgi:hypothetical protein
MTISDLIDYLLGRATTHDLALELVHVQDLRSQASSARDEVT